MNHTQKDIEAYLKYESETNYFEELAANDIWYNGVDYARANPIDDVEKLKAENKALIDNFAEFTADALIDLDKLKAENDRLREALKKLIDAVGMLPFRDIFPDIGEANKALEGKLG